MAVSEPNNHINNTRSEALNISVISQNVNRREFMKLPLEARRRILAEQAELMLVHYQQNKEWQELDIGDLLDY